MANVNPEFVSGAPEQLTAATVVADLIYTAGVLLFARWLIRTSLGRKALAGVPTRRNRMGAYVPFILFFVWIVGAGLLQPIIDQIIGTGEHPRRLFSSILNFLLFYHFHIAIIEAIHVRVAVVTAMVVFLLIGSIPALPIIAAMLLTARYSFARGLRGLGLDPKTIHRDFAFAVVDLLAVWPLVVAAITVTTSVCQIIWRLLWGKQFEMPQHEALKLIAETPFPLPLLIVFLAVVIAPVVEEMLFRGMIQTTLRSYSGRPWLAIAITAALFASVHANGTHWPALFVLALGLGYAYEKSGSLFRSIFMHALFNGITIVAALTEPQAWLR